MLNVQIKEILQSEEVSPGWKYETHSIARTGNVVLYFAKTYTTGTSHEEEVNFLYSRARALIESLGFKYVCRRFTQDLGIHETLIPAYEKTLWDKREDGLLYPIMCGNDEVLFFEITGKL